MKTEEKKLVKTEKAETPQGKSEIQKQKGGVAVSAEKKPTGEGSKKNEEVIALDVDIESFLMG